MIRKLFIFNLYSDRIFRIYIVNNKTFKKNCLSIAKVHTMNRFKYLH